MSLEVVEVTRDSKFQISYKLSDGTASAFRVTEQMADMLIEALEECQSKFKLRGATFQFKISRGD